MSKELMMENIRKAGEHIESMRPVIEHAKMRQRYHFMGEEGWINDPNGLIFFRGQYHFFYQFNPYDAYWGAMHWGHAVSDDLVHWEYLPIALAPSEPYDNHPEGGCFSGSAIEYDGKLWLMYTGTTNYGDGFIQSQCVAYSEDGIHFEKYEGNPVIKAPEGYEDLNFRDPKVWEHEGTFYAVVGAKKDNKAQALLYRSGDMKHWEFFNILAESRGELGYMWECPDFYPIGDKYVLMFSPMGVGERTTVYLVGDMDYGTGKFTYTVSGEIDWGFDFYAPQSFVDAKGRRLIAGWANGWDWMPWWKDWGPTFREGWCGGFNLVREVRLMPDNTLQFLPAAEYEILREKPFAEEETEISDVPAVLEAGDGVSFEVKLAIDLKKTTASRFLMKLRCKGDRESVLCFDFKKAELSFDRNKSDGWSKGVSRSPMCLKGKEELDVHIYADQSSIEVFTDNYQNNHSCNVFAESWQDENRMMAEDGVVVLKSVETWGMKASMNNN